MILRPGVHVACCWCRRGDTATIIKRLDEQGAVINLPRNWAFVASDNPNRLETLHLEAPRCSHPTSAATDHVACDDCLRTGRTT